VTEVDTSHPVVPDRLRDDGDFRRYFSARLLSSTGTAVTFVALPVLVYRLSGSPFLTALVSALEAVPYLVFGLVFGALTDRWDRQRVMVFADLAAGAVMGSIPLAHFLGVLAVPQVMVVAFVVPSLATLFDGANFGALPVLVGRDRIAIANTAVFGSATAVEIVVPGLVGLGMAVINPATLLVVDALSFVASALLIRGVVRAMHDRSRVPGPLTRQALLGDIGEGLRFLVGHPGVRTMTVIGTVQCISGGGFTALLVVWCDRVLDVGTDGIRFGLIYCGWSIGSLLATVLLSRLLRTYSPADVALGALPVSAVLGVLTALAEDWRFAALGLLGWAIAYTMVIVNTISYRQQVTPEPLLGRVNLAGRMLSWGLGWTIGSALGGLLGQLVGIRPALVAAAALGFLSVLIAWTSPLRGQRGGPLVAPVEDTGDTISST
jgi:MFS family permease